MSASTTNGPPFRADHVGSLLRPDALRRAFRDHREGRIGDAEFETAQDVAIREAVAMQEAVGLHAITDGEFRRASYWSHFVEAVGGFTVRPAAFTFRDQSEDDQQFLAPHVEGRIRRTRPISGGELAYLREVTRETPKITLPSPPTMHFWRGRDGVSMQAYRDEAEYFADLAAVYREEIAALATAGATYLQIDEVPLAMLCDERVREATVASGADPQRRVDDYVDLINAALRDRPAGVTVAMHLCRGNFKGKWLSEGGYHHVAERLFNAIDVDAYFLEYDTPRAGDFAPLAAVPAGKRVVLGLVSTKTPAMEPVDDLCRRVDEATRHLSLDQLAVSPQCGFASTVAGNPVDESVQRAKLALVCEVARRVWG